MNLSIVLRARLREILSLECRLYGDGDPSWSQNSGKEFLLFTEKSVIDSDVNLNFVYYLQVGLILIGRQQIIIIIIIIIVK